MSTRQTKARILDAALELFNTHGATAVTTNHIAASAGLSPGNLYYHYRNKEAIIRDLVQERLFPALNAIWAPPQEAAPTLADLHALLERHFQLWWQYRFFRDVLNLVRNDPLLGELYRKIYAQRMQNIQALVGRLVVSGVLQPPTTPGQYTDIATTAWIIATYWLAYLETMGEAVTLQQVQRGAALVMQMLRPYLSLGSVR
jgi:AcrR family transcriptional regulator